MENIKENKVVIETKSKNVLDSLCPNYCEKEECENCLIKDMREHIKNK